MTPKLLDKFGIPIIVLFVFFMFYKPEVCPLIIGALLIYVAVYYWHYLKMITNEGARAIGIILEYQRDNYGYKVPVIEFTAADEQKINGKPFYYTATDLAKFRSYKKYVNTEVIINYLPNKPHIFVIAKERYYNYLSLSLMLLIGSIFLTVGIAAVAGYIEFS